MGYNIKTKEQLLELSQRLLNINKYLLKTIEENQIIIKLNTEMLKKDGKNTL